MPSEADRYQDLSRIRVAGRSTAMGKDQYGKMDEQRRWTRVLVRRDGRWQFVHFQATPISKP
jgi:hypothetical protein